MAFDPNKLKQLLETRERLRKVPGYAADSAADVADYVAEHSESILAAFQNSPARAGGSVGCVDPGTLVGPVSLRPWQPASAGVEGEPRYSVEIFRLWLFENDLLHHNGINMTFLSLSEALHKIAERVAADAERAKLGELK